MKKFLIEIYNCWIGFRNYILREWIMYMPFYWIRHFFVRQTIHKFGHGCSVMMRVEIRAGKNISIGDHTIINTRTLLDGRGGKILIGNNVDIAQETNIWTLEHDVKSDDHTTIGADVIIEDHVWIASRVTILPGVKIGKGAVVSSCSLVTKDVPAMAIVGGVPARIIGERKSSLNYQLNYRPWFK